MVAETQKQRWERDTLETTLEKSPERAGVFTTISGRPIERLYTAEDVEGIATAHPGEFPYTRGIHPTGYRGKLWTMRQVGVNDFVQESDPPLQILYIDESAGDTQLAKLELLRKTRNNDQVARALDRMRAAARSADNVMIPILDAVRACATVGEMCDALRDVWGEYVEVPII
jgi:methylmalonyl-CoA mutase N-terminal domain/subunit